MAKVKKTTTKKKPSSVSFKAEISDDLKKEIKNSCENRTCGCNKSSCSVGCMYWLGYVGAAIYFISTATSFWVGLWGVIKAFAWPAILVFELMKLIGL